MKLPSSIKPIRAYSEARFPLCFLLLDRMGAIAALAERHYEKEVKVEPDLISAIGENDDTLFRITGETFWIARRESNGEDLDMTSYLHSVADQYKELAEVLEIENFDILNLQIFYKEEFDTVNDAVSTFKQRFIDYSETPFATISGSPKKFMINFAAAEGSYLKELVITPVSDGSQKGEQPAGGILLDLNIFVKTAIKVDECEEVLNELATLSKKTISAFLEGFHKQDTDRVAGL